MTKVGQNYHVLDMLVKGYKCTSYEAFVGIGCTRLASRIYDLKKMGYMISKKMHRNIDSNYAEYYMTAEQRAHARKMGGGK